MSIARSSSPWKNITILIVACCLTLPTQAKYGGGSGTEEDPYQIWDVNHMQAIGADANDWDKCFKLMADIDLSAFTGTQFNIIGYWNSSEDNAAFNGVFDGNGNKISNFTYISTGTSYIGLFGYVFGYNAEIKNLGLIDPSVSAGGVVGSLVGFIEAGSISNCYFKGGTVSGNWSVGGLVGWNTGTVTNCYATGVVDGNTGVVYMLERHG